ncbi:hypothetical protein [Acidovorax sp. Root217]|uniref:hypothetical protein n=1 Tax=Acidovorax sp. Root217 TaxID=1736492 RepID=UPI0012F7515D|nr:hypothetical protein [Acidovorax sp. Root217]
MPPHPAPRLCAAFIRWLRTVVMAPPPSGATPWVTPRLPCKHYQHPWPQATTERDTREY